MNTRMTIMLWVLASFLLPPCLMGAERGGFTPPKPFTVAVVGDSTVCDYPATHAARGWGQYLGTYFTNTVRIVNMAKSGRSTKTFIKEGLWAKTLRERPDLVLVQFGHNDSHAPDRPESTRADTDYADYLRQYVDEGRAVGAVPVLVTPMHRRVFATDGTLDDILQPYADAMKAVGAEKQVTVIDLHAASGRLFAQLGPEGSHAMNSTLGDTTHFNERGARAMADLVMRELVQVPLVNAHLQTGAIANHRDGLPSRR